MKRITMLVALEKMGFTRCSVVIGDDARDALMFEWSHGEIAYVAADGFRTMKLLDAEDMRIFSVDVDRNVLTTKTTGDEGAVLDAALDALNAGNERLKGIVEYCGLLDISEDERKRLAGQALDAACRTIQRAIGQTDGGVAGMYFSGTTHAEIIGHFDQYIRDELHAMD